MKITNINGSLIEVTDLDKAIKQADNFRKMRHEDKRYASLNVQLNRYWQHIYDELLKLKQQQP